MNKNFRTWLKNQNIDVIEGSYYREEATGYVYFYYLSRKKDNSKTIMFIHGTGNDGLFLTESLFKTLIEAGYNIFTFDIDGHGFKSTSRLFQTHLESCILSAYKQLVTIIGSPNTLYIIGYSVGGLIGLQELSKRRIPIQGLVCIATPFKLTLKPNKIYKELFTLTQKEFYDFARHWGIRSLFPAFGPFNRKRFPIRLGHRPNGSWSYIKFVKQFINERNWVDLNIKASDRLMGLFGEEDFIADTKKAAEIFKSWQQSNLIIVPNANHYNITLSGQALGHIVKFLETQHEG